MAAVLQATLPEPVDGCSFVYALLDPRTGEFRYVGRTRSPRVRRTAHYVDRNGKRTPLATWHCELDALSLRPVMQILEGPLPYFEIARREQEWQRHLLAQGVSLLNVKSCCDGRHDGEMRWTFATASAAVLQLVDALDLRVLYPTLEQFERYALSGLATSVDRRLGGHARLAAALGLRRAKYSVEEAWTLEAAVEAVRRLAKQSGDRYPSPSEFYAYGASGLYQAIHKRLGGHAEIAEALGFARPRNQWTPERATTAVIDLVASLELDRYPTVAEFEAAGLAGAWHAIEVRFGGHSAFATRLMLPTAHRRRWTEAECMKEVLALAARAAPDGRYPTQHQFNEAGLSGLRCAIAKRHGGHRAFADRLRLRISPRGPS